jgi:hypothetical protein
LLRVIKTRIKDVVSNSEQRLFQVRLLGRDDGVGPRPDRLPAHESRGRLLEDDGPRPEGGGWSAARLPPTAARRVRGLAHQPGWTIQSCLLLSETESLTYNNFKSTFDPDLTLSTSL